MNRTVPALLALTLLLSASVANAQSPVGQPPVAPYSQPVLNPYLNLLHSGNPAINYYGIVRPQVQQQQQLQMLQYGLARTDAEIAATPPATAAGPLPDTGHTAGFMTYTRYFNTVNPVGARGR